MNQPLRFAFREDVEGLRGVAVLMVILFHAGLDFARGGFYGVDVFLVISGYLILGLLVRESERTGTISLADFWARRARRLLPAATLVFCATLWLAYRYGGPTSLAENAASARAAALYATNFLFVWQGADYFRPNVQTDPFLHTWSLALEEQFYLVVAPSLLLLVWLWTRGNRERPPRTLFLYAFAAVTIASYALNVFLLRRNPLSAFYLLPTRAWEFGVGGVVAVLGARWERLTTNDRRLLGFGGIVALLASIPIGELDTRSPAFVSLLPVLGTAAILASGEGGRTTGVQRILGSRLMRSLGALSYSWYLWHWPLASMWALLPGLSGVPMWLGMPIVSLALAALTYRLVEQPVRHASALTVAPWRSIAVGGALALGVALVATGARRLSREWLERPELAFVAAARTIDEGRAAGCNLSFVQEELRLCTLGDATAARTVALFGDSHAAHFTPAIDSAGKLQHVRIAYFSKQGCPWIDVSTVVMRTRRRYEECERWRDRVVQHLELHPPTAVMLAATRNFVIVDSAGTHLLPERDSSAYARAWRLGAERIVRRLSARMRVIVVHDVPRPAFDVPACIERHLHDMDACDFDRLRASAGAPWGEERALVQNTDGVRLLDLTDAFCGGERCRAVVDGVVTFRDGNHVSAPFARLLSAAFGRVLASLAPADVRMPVTAVTQEANGSVSDRLAVKAPM